MKEIPFREDYQLYGRVTRVLGNMRFTLLCSDNIARIGILRGKMYRRKWLKVNDVVLADVREFQDSKLDITHIYDNDDIKYLLKLQEIDYKFLHGKEEDSEEITQEEIEESFTFDETTGIGPEDVELDIDDI